MDKVCVQTQDFNVADEVAILEDNNLVDGATVTFIGRVRNQNENQNVTSLFLEHYPGMTEKSLHNIVADARIKWPLGRITVIHRVGELKIGEQIVFVGVTSPHRQAAFEATEFIMDFLKVKAPFWKKEQTDSGEKWLDAKSSDESKAKGWQ